MSSRLIRNRIILWSIILIISIIAFTVFSINSKKLKNKALNSAFYGGIFESNIMGNSFEKIDRSRFIVIKEQVINDNISDITIDWISGYVTVHKSENDEIKIVQKALDIFPKEELFSYSVNRGKLNIKDERQDKPKKGITIINEKQTDLEVYIPEKEYNSININGVSSDITAENLKAKKVIFNTISGDINFSGIFSNINLTSVSGDIKSDNLRADKLSINTTSGDMNLSGEFTDVDIITISGDVKSSSLNAEKASLSSTSGDISISGKLTELDINTVSGNVEVRSSNMLKRIDSHSVSGDVTITIPENDGFTVNINKSSDRLKSDFALTKNEDNKYVYRNGTAKFTVSTVNGYFKINEGK